MGGGGAECERSPYLKGRVRGHCATDEDDNDDDDGMLDGCVVLAVPR
jgi:hypothetical protein